MSASGEVSGIAGRYAGALFELARESNVEDAVGTELQSFLGALNGNRDLDQLVKNPTFPKEEQIKGLRLILPLTGVGGLTTNFILLLASKRRLFLVRNIIASYQELLMKSKNIAKVEVTTAQPLTPENRNLLGQVISNKLKSGVMFVEKVNPQILGGVIVKTGSKMVDASLQTRLNQLKLNVLSSS